MSEITRRKMLGTGTTMAACVSLGLTSGKAAAQNGTGFMAASGGPQDKGPMKPGLQGIYAVCEVTGGGEKVYAIAAEYDVDIAPQSLAPDSYVAGVVPAAAGYYPGMPDGVDKDATDAAPVPREVVAIYTNSAPERRLDRKSVPGRYVIAEFEHDEDLSLPTTDSTKVVLTQLAQVKTVAGAVYAASPTTFTNLGRRGNATTIRYVDDWEQSHWWWDNSRATWLEYSIYLPKSWYEPGGEDKAYPLILAVTHSGTSYDGTCAETLTETCIASIWSYPEVQDELECVVITPRYERTTLNDYWEHTHDVENTHRLVESLLSNSWNYGNPNNEKSRDKVLKIDPDRVYCTGWSMGAMTSLWLMAHHPETYAAGLIIAGQQRPQDVAALATQKALIITGSRDGKATPWNERCIPVWEEGGAKVVRPEELLDPELIFPVGDQKELTKQVDGYLAEGGNITFLTFEGVDHMASARKFFYIKAARDWLLNQKKA